MGFLSLKPGLWGGRARSESDDTGVFLQNGFLVTQSDQEVMRSAPSVKWPGAHQGGEMGLALLGVTIGKQ